ncbi:MAG: hypothetical protein ISEC1_P2070 [Thiomicrorhabdus sp.]|nr:MAG: hypothetical protein ISEC1_P2070 [Thiomicrorhabdus sp.]
MKAQITVLYAQHGTYDDEQTKKQMPWANLYTLGDPEIKPNLVGVKPGKMSIVDIHGNPDPELALKILEKISAAKSFPCQLNVSLAQKVVDQKLTLAVNGLTD